MALFIVGEITLFALFSLLKDLLCKLWETGMPMFLNNAVQAGEVTLHKYNRHELTVSF